MESLWSPEEIEEIKQAIKRGNEGKSKYQIWLNGM